MANPRSLTGQYLSGARRSRCPPSAARSTRTRTLKRHRRTRQQPARTSPPRSRSARFTCITGVSGGGKSTLLIDTLYKAVARRLNNAREHPAPLRQARRPRAPRQGHRHRPVAHRPHAALEPRDLHRRLHADPRAGSPGLPEAQGARLRARALLVQRQGRPLRGLPGRRRHQDRDALPARRLRHLRRLQGQALQPRDAGGHLPRQVHRRRARHDGRGRRRVLQGRAADPRQAGDAGTASASATSTSASRRRRSRAARRSASSCPRSCPAAPPGARSTSSTSPPPACTSTTWRSSWRCCTSWSTPATRWW